MGAYQEHAVLVGGLAPFVYQHHAAFDRAMPLPPLGTKDADMAVPLPLPVIAGTTLHRRLVEGGLVSGVGRGTDGGASITRFFLPGKRGSDAPYLEFLVRNPGRRREMEGRPQSDLLAHTGDFQELLLDPTPTWAVPIPEIGTVRVPHPVGYIAQKTRMYDKVGARWAKDQGDVLLVVWAFHARWPEMALVWQDLRRRNRQGAWLDRVQKIWTRLYARPDGEGALAVTDIHRQRARVTVPPAAIHQVMMDFLAVIAAQPGR
jgi:hypothetical protein